MTDRTFNSDADRRSHEVAIACDAAEYYRDHVIGDEPRTTSPWEKAIKDVESYSDSHLLAIWAALKDYDPRDNRDGLPMDDWASLVMGEMDKRRIKYPI